MERNYNKTGEKKIAKIRYRFKKGYLQVTLSEKDVVKRELMNVMSTCDPAYFSRVLNNGFINISLPRYEAINRIFARRGITDVWETEEI